MPSRDTTGHEDSHALWRLLDAEERRQWRAELAELDDLEALAAERVPVVQAADHALGAMVKFVLVDMLLLVPTGLVVITVGWLVVEKLARLVAWVYLMLGGAL